MPFKTDNKSTNPFSGIIDRYIQPFCSYVDVSFLIWPRRLEASGYSSVNTITYVAGLIVRNTRRFISDISFLRTEENKLRRKYLSRNVPTLTNAAVSDFRLTGKFHGSADAGQSSAFAASETRMFGFVAVGVGSRGYTIADYLAWASLALSNQIDAVISFL